MTEPLDTLEKFLAAMPTDGWELDEFGRIRRGCECPVSSLIGEHCDYYLSVGQIKGMPHDLMRDIIRAADANPGLPSYAATRAALLARGGLSEVAQ